ncbi:MAG: hypothetical protein Q7U54_20680 [Bacteroidales bacterium]|nr:hypothetical protein [Bacteroidales bacterium]
MSLLTATEVNQIAFITPIDSALILDEIIQIAETKYIIPAITKPVYDDLSVHPGIYATFILDYIKPYLAYCVKYLLYSQYYSETLSTSNFDKSREEIVNNTNVILQAKKELLKTHLTSGVYPPYNLPVKKRISGFFIK